VADLSATDRDRVGRFFMRQGPTLGTCAFTKPDLVAAIADTDNWIDDNTASFNTALSQPFRTSATLQQKTLLFCWVALRRAGLLHVDEDG
jgi:hypothetical protein